MFPTRTEEADEQGDPETSPPGSSSPVSPVSASTGPSPSAQHRRAVPSLSPGTPGGPWAPRGPRGFLPHRDDSKRAPAGCPSQALAEPGGMRLRRPPRTRPIPLIPLVPFVPPFVPDREPCSPKGPYLEMSSSKEKATRLLLWIFIWIPSGKLKRRV